MGASFVQVQSIRSSARLKDCGADLTDLPAQQACVFVYDWLKHGVPEIEEFQKADTVAKKGKAAMTVLTSVCLRVRDRAGSIRRKWRQRRDSNPLRPALQASASTASALPPQLLKSSRDDRTKRRHA
jgi:hypothetical protein